MKLPPGFIEMAHNLLGGEADDFLLAMQKPPVVSVRKNSRKPSLCFEGERRVAWCEKGVYLNQRPVFTLDPLLHAGAYYVQDASSMILYEASRRLVKVLQDDAGKTGSVMPVSVLDMCAAPGGKTTAIIDAVPDGSRIVANEYVAKRAAILRENLAKWGYPGATVTNRDSSWFAINGDKFDIVAVDAPCSGEGMMRKDQDAVSQWSEELVKSCATLQRRILENAAAAVKDGGFLIYSTCTFNRTENEENAAFICDTLGLEPFDPAFPEEWGIPRGIGTDLPVFRFMPHKTEGEGLFLAIFHKPGLFTPSRIAMPAVSQSARNSAADNASRKDKRIAKADRHKGKPAKDSRKDDASPGNVPEIELILSVDFDKTAYPLAELTLEQALAYLRRESVVLSPETPKGIVIVTYKGLPLGAAKNIGTRANNLYPKNWRILMR